MSRLSQMSFLAFLTVGISVCSSNSRATTWYILPNGTGDAPTIQAGVDSATAGDTVMLANGMFTGPGNRDVSWIGKGIVVRSESNDPDLCVVDCQGSVTESHQGFTIQEPDTGITLEGITVTHAYPIGIRVEGNAVTPLTLTISNCVFQGDSIAVSLDSDGVEFTVTGCDFIDNWLGLRFFGLGGGAELIVDDCSFSGHTGYALTVTERPDLVRITDCEFRNNPGFGLILSEALAFVADCTFENNRRALELNSGRFDIRRSAFIGNSDTALRVEQQFEATVTDCVFLSNSGVNGGAVETSFSGTLAIVNTVFANNSATRGGALYVEFPFQTQSLVNCTLYGNSAVAGGGLFIKGSDGAIPGVSVEKTIIAFGSQGEAVYCADSVATVNITCSDVYGNTGGDWVGCIAGQLTVPSGNMFIDPLFCDPVNGDFTVGADSPCLPYSLFNNCNVLIGAKGQGCSTPTGVAESPVSFRELTMRSYPNPLTSRTALDYVLPADGFVEIVIYDVAGHRVTTLERAEKPKGPNSVIWNSRGDDGNEVTSGIYFARLIFGNEVRGQKLIVLR